MIDNLFEGTRQRLPLHGITNHEFIRA